MHKPLRLRLYYAITLGCLWQPFFLNASQPFKDENKEDKASSIILKQPSSIDTCQAPLSPNLSTQPQLLTHESDLPYSIKKHQDDLQTVILQSLQARADALSPVVAQMKEALASLPDSSKRVLRQREAFLLDPSLSTYSPLGFLRRKEKILTEVILNPQHLSFERLREVIAHLDALIKDESIIVDLPLTSCLQKLKEVYESFITDLCTRRPEERSSLLSSIPIDGEFFDMPFVIAQEQAYDLLSFDEYGIPFKNNLLGSSVVTKVEGIHAKSTLIRVNQEGTLDPGMEWAVSSFHHMLFGEGMVPSSLLILRDVTHQVALTDTEAERLVNEAKTPQYPAQEKKKILNRLHEEESLISQFRKTHQSFAVQVTPHIEGIHLATFLEQAYNDPSLWDTLDSYNVQSLLLTALLTSPNDAKGDNFIVKREEIKENDGSIKSVNKIIGIDNDRAFYPYISTSSPHNHYLDIRHILFLYPQVMNAPLIQKVKDQFLSHHPALFLLNWLKVLNHHNDKYEHLLTQGRIIKDLFDTLHLPFKVRLGSIGAILKRFLIIHQELTLNRASEITASQLLKTISPFTASCYEILPKKYSYDKIIHKIYNESLENILEQELQDSPLQEALSHEKEDGTNLQVREQSLGEATIEILDTIELQALSTIIRKQVLEEVFLSHSKLVSQAQHPQWTSSYLIHEGLKHKDALFSLSLLKTLINKFPQSLTLLDEEQGYAPLHYAIENGADSSILEFLLKASVDVNQRTMPKVGSSLTPLDLACLRNKGDAFKLLVEHGTTEVSASLALRFYKSLLASTSISSSLPLSSFLTLTSKHQELHWLLSLDHLLPSQGEGVMLKTASQDQRVILNTYRLLQPISRMPLAELTNKVIDAKGNIINVMPEGRHPVGKISLPFHNLRLSLYFKEYPELPGLEEAVASLMRMTFGFGAPYSELIKLEGKPVLVSQGIHGRTVKAVLKDNPSHLKTLDPYSTSSLILLSMLINPEDGKPDNYILEERPEGNRLIAIDNDHAFVPAIAKSKSFGRPVVQVKTILYCLDQMQEKVHPQAREQFLKLNVGEVLESWLRHLRALNAQYHELFTEPERVKYMKEKECYIGIPFQEGAIKELYQKMSRLQSLLHDKPHLTHLELLCQLEPYLGKRYKPAFESPLSVQARFDLIDKPFFSKDGKTITSSGHILSSMNIPLQESLLESAKRDLTKDKDYRPNKALEELKAIKQENVEAILKEQGISKLNLTNLKGVKLEDNLSQVLKKIDFKSIPEVDQRALFELLKQRPFKALILKNAQALQNDFIKQHLSFEHLKELNLTGCLAITDDILPILAEKAPALESLNMSYLPKLKNFARVSFFGKQEPYTFNMLRSLNLSHCKGLETIIILTPALEKLKLEGCQNVKSFKFSNMPYLKHIDLRYVRIIDNTIFLELINPTKNLERLKLEGCVSFEDKELWEAFPQLMKNYSDILQKFREDIKAYLLKTRPFKNLNFNNSKIDVNTLEIIVSNLCKKIDTIESLNLQGNNISDENIKVIIQTLVLSKLSSLNLQDNNIDNEGAKVISQSSNLCKLSSLNLGGNNIRTEGAIALSQSSNLCKLSSLNLEGNNIGAKGAIALSQSSNFKNLSYLDLRGNNIGGKGAKAISQSSILSNLYFLNLRYNNIRTEGAIALSQNSNLKKLSILDLAINDIEDKGIMAINQSLTLVNLSYLDLESNWIEDEGSIAISQSSTFTNLTYLNLGNNNIGDKGKKTIRESEMLTKLKNLRL